MKKVVRLTESQLVELIERIVQQENTHVIEEGWFGDMIEDLQYNLKIYLGIGLLLSYGVYSGIKIYEKSQELSGEEYYQEILKPALKLQGKKKLSELSSEVGEKDILMYIQQNPDEFVIGENGEIFHKD
jgi:hypothetical protein